MLDGEPIVYWVGFHVIVLLLIGIDLAVLGRGKPATRTRQNLFFVPFLFALAACFAVWIAHVGTHQMALEFASGYLIELALSIDNLFVFMLMFRSFGLDAKAQRKALLLGIVGAIVMRGVFIFAGIALLQRFSWIQYVFGAFLVIAASRLLAGKKKDNESVSSKWLTRWTTRWKGKGHATFIAAVVAIELVDVVFALDSVPAVLAISHHPFVVYTSNIFAILGLRSLYFLLADLLGRLRYLHVGLAVILGYVGCKMLFEKWVHVPVAMSLGVIAMVVLIATVASLISTRNQKTPAASNP